jgi:hypothetical protein
MRQKRAIKNDLTPFITLLVRFQPDDAPFFLSPQQDFSRPFPFDAFVCRLARRRFCPSLSSCRPTKMRQAEAARPGR